MLSYDPKKIEKKWQKKWEKEKIYRAGKESGDKSQKCYVLDMFPYPSGEGLHVGHPKGYIATDIYSRFKRMNGANVLHPMGWDAFGLPAENFAIKNKVHPRAAMEKNIARYKEQLSIIGFDYDWSREINTTDPAYYKWTQWIFLKMLERGLAYQSHEPINWCPSCQTGLANEDLEDDKCERCGSVVEKRPMRQWVLKITEYAERLLADLGALNWPESIKESQRNWIGKNEGMLFTALIKDTKLTLQTFSVHFEAFAADTFVVIAPDHPLLPKLVEDVSNKKEILDFADKLVERRKARGFAEENESEGIFTGRYIVDPVGNGDLPIWIASYALADYGTGIVKSSCHDERDFKFAKKYGIKLKPVLFPEDEDIAEKVKNLEICFTDTKNGILREPKEFDGKRARQEKQNIISYLEKNKLAVRKTTYRLKDWVFSRQRYWGEPIPVIHCEKCGVVPVPEKDLPVKLPEVKNYAPTGTGESPLAAMEKWVNVKCPKCGGKAKRETNTMPQWAGSSWYYLRYMDPKNKRALVDPKKEKYWAPVDVYVGGVEHATRHLIYARFWHKFLHDIGAVSTTEPFLRFHNVGLILAEDGKKMSKRYGNVINPDDIVETYGADTLRIYEMFMGPFGQSISWDTKSIIGSRRFIEKIWRIAGKVSDSTNTTEPDFPKSTETLLHKTIKKVGEDIESFNFNTAISAMMMLLNEIEKLEKVSRTAFEIILKLVAPFAPHVADELWSNLGNKKSIHISAWPAYESKKLAEEKVRIAVQVNGKVRGSMEIETDAGEEAVRKQASELEIVKKWLKNGLIQKVIYVKNRLINLIG